MALITVIKERQLPFTLHRSQLSSNTIIENKAIDQIVGQKYHGRPGHIKVQISLEALKNVTLKIVATCFFCSDSPTLQITSLHLLKCHWT